MRCAAAIPGCVGCDVVWWFGKHEVMDGCSVCVVIVMQLLCTGYAVVMQLLCSCYVWVCGACDVLLYTCYALVM